MKTTRTTQIITVLTVALFLLVAACGGGGGDSSVGGDDGSTPTDPPFRDGDEAALTAPAQETNSQVDVSFVDFQHRNSNFSDNGLQQDPVENELFQAESTIDVAAPLISRQDFVNDLITLSERVRVRIVTEKAFYEDPNFKPFYNQLESAGINVHTDNDGFPRLMHSRFIVIDRAQVLTGNFAFASEGVDRHTGDLLNIRHSGVAQAFTDEFNQMFLEGNFGPEKRITTRQTFVTSTDSEGEPTSAIDVYFGPTTDLRTVLEEQILPGGSGLPEPDAIWMGVKQWRDPALLNVFRTWYSNPDDPKGFYAVINDQDAVAQGIVGQIVSDIEGAGGGGDEINLETASINVANDQLVNYEDNTLNSKYLYLDVDGPGGTLTGGAVNHGGDRVVVTTANFTVNGFELNDEIMLVLRGDPLAQKYAGRINPFLNVAPRIEGQPGELVEPERFGEVFANHHAYPHEVALGVPQSEVAQGVVYGKAENFTETVVPPSEDEDQGDGGGDGGLGGGGGGSIGEEDENEIPITLNFTFEGRTWFEGSEFEFQGREFQRSASVNPDFSYLQVVPAGELTMTVQTVPQGGQGELGEIEPTDFEFLIGPGAVRNLDITVNTEPQQEEGQGGGGDGGGTGGGGGFGGF